MARWSQWHGKDGKLPRGPETLERKRPRKTGSGQPVTYAKIAKQLGEAYIDALQEVNTIALPMHEAILTLNDVSGQSIPELTALEEHVASLTDTDTDIEETKARLRSLEQCPADRKEDEAKFHLSFLSVTIPALQETMDDCKEKCAAFSAATHDISFHEMPEEEREVAAEYFEKIRTDSDRFNHSLEDEINALNASITLATQQTDSLKPDYAKRARRDLLSVHFENPPPGSRKR